MFEQQPHPPVVEFAFAGPLRDQLVAAILSGAKTSTTSTLVEYSIENEPLPVVGGRQTVVDSDDTAVAVIETTQVAVVALASVDLRHAHDEGEGYTSVAEWRAGHERFWRGETMRAWLGDDDFTVDDETMVVLERFRLVEIL